MATTTEIAGYIASALVLTTFATNDLRRLRMIAILSNIAFITYGVLAWLPPVLVLHLLLLPLNVALLIGCGKVVRAVPSSISPAASSSFPRIWGSAVRKRRALRTGGCRFVRRALPARPRPRCRGRRSRHRDCAHALAG
jgi:hypothetical protein